jgi:hypothetical protein
VLLHVTRKTLIFVQDIQSPYPHKNTEFFENDDAIH